MPDNRPEHPLSAWAERRPDRSEGERRGYADALAAHLPKPPFWSDEDMNAIMAAFIVRFNEDLPRTETLMATTYVGYCMALRDMREGKLR